MMNVNHLPVRKLLEALRDQLANIDLDQSTKPASPGSIDLNVIAQKEERMRDAAFALLVELRGFE